MAVEVYSFSPDHTRGQQVYPDKTKPLTKPEIARVLAQASFTGLFHIHLETEEGSYFVTSNDRSFVEDIKLERGEAQDKKGYKKVADKIEELRPGEDIKVVIY